MTRDEESELVEAAKNGNQDAFTSLWKAYYNVTKWTAMKILRDEEKSDEAASEALRKAFLGIAKFDGTSRFSTWLHTIVTNECFRVLRYNKAAKRKGETLSLDAMIETDSGEEGNISAAELSLLKYSPEIFDDQSTAGYSRRDSLIRALEALNPLDRMCISLFHLEGYSLIDIAEMLNMQVQQVKDVLMDGRKRLGELLLAQAKTEGVQ